MCMARNINYLVLNHNHFVLWSAVAILAVSCGLPALCLFLVSYLLLIGELIGEL